MSQPLKDLSNGRLQGWPGGELYLPDGRILHTFHRARVDETPRATVRIVPGMGRWIYCKYCRRQTQPLALDETLSNQSPTWRMVICAACGYGLTPPEQLNDSLNREPETL